MKWLLTLLVVVAVSLEHSEAGFFDNLDDWENGEAILEDNVSDNEDYDDDDAGRGLISKLKTFQVKKKCSCQETVCGCCMFTLFNDETACSACFNITQGADLKEKKKIEASLVVNGKKLYTKLIGEKKKCGKIPYTGEVARACLYLYNTTVDANGIHSCLKLSLKLFSKQLLTFDFQCLRLAKKQLTVEKGSGSPKTGIINIDVDVNKLKTQMKKFKKFFQKNFSKFVNLFKKDKNKKKPK